MELKEQNKKNDEYHLFVLDFTVDMVSLIHVFMTSS